ncbi:MAG TPA: ribosome-recycling factor, partial [Candidatus Atribacteria bacterium]|nr:ribosome-recycling factor [Candidatus Atribacteria bacterium]
DSAVIRITMPPLTEERRKEIAKMAKKWVEEAKVAIRNLRREANEEIKKMEKEGKISEDESERARAEVQKLTDEHINELDDLWERKEKEIMSI